MPEPKDIDLESRGIFHVERLDPGTYRNVKLNAHSSGSIHVLGEVIVTEKLTLVANDSATILLPKN